METNTQNEMSISGTVSEVVSTVTDSLQGQTESNAELTAEVTENKQLDANQPHAHNSALAAAAKAHSAVHHVMPHHRGLDL